MSGSGSPQTVVQVRPATVADAADVVALVQSAYRAEESRLGWTTEADLVGGQRVDAAMVAALVEADGSAVLVGTGGSDLEERPASEHASASVQDGATPSSGPVTRILACCHVERRGAAAYVGMFAVRPRLQGRGLGRDMLSAAAAQAAEWGAVRLELSVLNHRPELIAWYERCGFALTGEERAFPYGDERFGRPLRDDLSLLTMVRDIRAG